MNAKTRKWNTRTVIYILLILVIIAAVIYYITLPKSEDNTLSLKRLIENKENYDNKDVEVEGIYFLDGNNRALRPPQMDTELYPNYILNLEIPEKLLENNTLNENVKYIMKGTFKIEKPENNNIPGAERNVLYVTEIDDI